MISLNKFLYIFSSAVFGLMMIATSAQAGGKSVAPVNSVSGKPNKTNLSDNIYTFQQYTSGGVNVYLHRSLDPTSGQLSYFQRVKTWGKRNTQGFQQATRSLEFFKRGDVTFAKISNWDYDKNTIKYLQRVSPKQWKTISASQYSEFFK